MFLGLRTVIYAAPDLVKAKAWYTQALGQEPYFAETFYVGFNVGGFELGLDPDTAKVKTGNNAVAYWGVPDAAAAHAPRPACAARGPCSPRAAGSPRVIPARGEHRDQGERRRQRQERNE